MADSRPKCASDTATFASAPQKSARSVAERNNGSLACRAQPQQHFAKTYDSLHAMTVPVFVCIVGIRLALCKDRTGEISAGN